MSDVLDVVVDTEEEEQFLRTYADMDFPRLGMACAVINCPVLALFTSYAKYVDHFVQRHRSFVHHYSCSTCKRRFRNKKNKRSHKVCKGSPSVFHLIKVVNKDFISPGNTRMPRAPKTTVQDVEKLPEFLPYKRSKLAEKRKEYAQYCAGRQSQADILNSFETKNLKVH